MPKQYPPEFRKQVVLSIKNGMSIAETHQKYQVPAGTLYRWIKEQNQTGTNISILDYSILRQKHNKQNHILEIIRLSEIIDKVPLQTRLEILVDLHERFDQYSVHELCEALNVSRGTFYNHIFRKADRTKYLEEQQQLLLQVQQIFDDSKQRYGAEKIRVILAERGICIGKKRVREVMQELDMMSIRENAKKDYRKRQEYRRKNLIQQNFYAERPNKVWVSDFTYFRIKDHFIFLCVIIDLFSRRVVGYKASRKASTQLVTATFRAARV